MTRKDRVPSFYSLPRRARVLRHLLQNGLHHWIPHDFLREREREREKKKKKREEEKRSK